MNVLLMNPPWYDEARPEWWGVRAGSRWPHFQPRTDIDTLPRYIPFPFMMAIAASVIQAKGYETRIIDAVAEGLTYESFYSKVEAFKPDIVFCETSTPSLNNDVAVLQKLKHVFPSLRIVAGGVHAPDLVQNVMAKHGVPDYWLAGEYDMSLFRCLEWMDGAIKQHDVQGLITPSVSTESFAVIDSLDALPRPLFDQLPMKNYADPVCGLPNPTAQSWLSRGCPFRCTFCVWPQLVYGSRRYRTRGVDTALDEIEHVIQHYGCESFYFDDDTTNIGEERMIQLAVSIKERGLDVYPWSMMARADCMTPAMLEAFADAGMYSVKYGVESISPALIDACNKSTDLERFHEAIYLTKEAGIKMHLTFTFGIPGETQETIRETIDFALESAPETAQFSICTPFPGTLFYQECKENGWLLTDDWSQYIGSGKAVVETPWLKAEELEFEYREAMSRWQQFVDSRLHERQTRLLSALKKVVLSGRQWAFSGDHDMAGFLFDKMDLQLKQGWIEQIREDRDDVAVVISRHDEEKIVRRLCREQHLSKDRLVTLYENH